MELRRPVVLAATGVLVGALCITGTAQAQPTPTAAPSAQAQAVSAAAGLVATRTRRAARQRGRRLPGPESDFLDERLQYIPYERSYKGLPVVGGDFVVATDLAARCSAPPSRRTRPSTSPRPPRRWSGGRGRGDRAAALVRRGQREPGPAGRLRARLRRRWPGRAPSSAATPKA